VTDVVAIKNLVEVAVSAAMAQVLPAELAGSDPLVRRSEHADFQSNVALAIAKQAKRPPREIAQAVADAIDAQTVSATTSGPGFLNLTVPDATLWERISERVTTDRLGISTPLTGERVVIDYSAPNIAKEMHVGHLRTTIIGDALARILGFLGADVVRQNHLGDWGTQFGMLIQYIDEHPELPWRHQGGDVSAPDALARAARAQFDADPAFADRARSRVVALQSGDAATLAVWRDLVADSELAFQALYDRLGVLLTPADSAGESTYNRFLADVVDELVDAGIAVESDGALCVFFDDITGPDGDPVPLIVRKSDGGFGYVATDLAWVASARPWTRATERKSRSTSTRATAHVPAQSPTARRAAAASIMDRGTANSRTRRQRERRESSFAIQESISTHLVRTGPPIYRERYSSRGSIQLPAPAMPGLRCRAQMSRGPTHGHRDGPVEGDHRVRRQSLQDLVQRGDLRPVGVLSGRSLTPRLTRGSDSTASARSSCPSITSVLPTRVRSV
jgi:arginyl-tRNA synthetase